jgi:poly(hydroxyalkanoate) depolymerase family esterase
MEVFGQAGAGLKRLWGEAAQLPFRPGDGPHPLAEVVGFGSNPGDLRMFAFVPDRLAAPRSLMVVLHGCTQTAAGYDEGAGWSTLAERYGFALVLPQQERANNPTTCFNWFQPEDIERDRGEAMSIRQMVEHTVALHGLDRGRIYVTGLSAGGAMTMVMLATYPELFAGGAPIAGLPYGCAGNLREALACMRSGCARSGAAWGDRVRAASGYRGPWPRLSVWHGSSDMTVSPLNANEILKQWTDLHGLGSRPGATETVDGYPRQVWRSPSGEEVIESFTITSMAHGTPLSTRRDPPNEPLGSPGPFLLEAGISSSYHIARFFGLTARPTDLVSDETAHDVVGLSASDAERSAEEVPTRVAALIRKALHFLGLR